MKFKKKKSKTIRLVKWGSPKELQKKKRDKKIELEMAWPEKYWSR